jgi:hypothetical protein
MVNRFTYSVQTSGFNKTLIVFDNSKIIYTGRPSPTSPIDGPNSLVSEAILFLRDTYGPSISNMVRVNAPNQAASVPTVESNQKQIDNIKDQQQAKKDTAEKALDDKQNFLEEQSKTSPTDAKKAIIGIILPLLTKFISAEKSANAIINKIINSTKRKLRDKGRVEVVGGKITFTPKNPGDYQRFKQDFDRKVNNLKNTVKALKTTVDALTTLLKVLQTALVAFKVLLTLKKKQLQIQAVAASTDLLTPSPVKAAASTYTISDRVSQDMTKNLEKKIDDYILLIGIINSILKIFQKLINSVKIKLETLSLTIISTNPTFTELSQIIDENPIAVSSTEAEYSNGEKQYIIKVTTTPSGALQAVAYDKFSMMKITQTAPSKLRRADELIDELKQILG